MAALEALVLISVAGLVAFSAGGGKVGLAIGPLLPILEAMPVHVPIHWVSSSAASGCCSGRGWPRPE